MILRGTPGTVTLKTDKDAHGVELSYPDMNYIAFWHTPETEAPFVCIEPWLSLPSRQDVVRTWSASRTSASSRPARSMKTA